MKFKKLFIAGFFLDVAKSIDIIKIHFVQSQKKSGLCGYVLVNRFLLSFKIFLILIILMVLRFELYPNILCYSKFN